MLDLVSSTRLARDLPLEHYAVLMTEFMQLLILSCEAWGGEVLQHLGDGVVACWPAEYSVRAVCCSVEAPARVARLGLARQLGLTLQVRGGMACGPVMMGQVGTQLTAYGLPMNLARRLCDSALPDQTLVCGDVQQQCLRENAPLRFRHRSDVPSLRGFGGDYLAYSAHTLPADSTVARMKVI